MKKVFFSLVIGSSIAFLSSCGGETKQEEKQDNHEQHDNHKEEKKAQCSYTIDSESLKLNWTAFKHTAKAPVGGVFDLVELGGVVEAETKIGALKNATISIYTNSVNSSNEGRDVKIKDSFFGTMQKTAILTGAIKEITGEESGKATIEITMNAVKKDLIFDFEINAENIITFKTEFSVNDFNAQTSLDALHEVCSEKHTGEDGKSILWPDVMVKISAKIIEDCK